MSSSTVDTGCVNPELEWSSAIQQAGKVSTLLSSIRTLAQDEKEYAKFLLSIVGHIRVCLERGVNERAVALLANDIPRLEDYRKTAISYLHQLGSKLDPEGCYGQNGLTGPTPQWRFTSDDVTHFVRLADQLYQKWDNWRMLVEAREYANCSF